LNIISVPMYQHIWHLPY